MYDKEKVPAPGIEEKKQYGSFLTLGTGYRYRNV
jgi:hypothetical protein